MFRDYRHSAIPSLSSNLFAHKNTHYSLRSTPPEVSPGEEKSDGWKSHPQRTPTIRQRPGRSDIR